MPHISYGAYLDADDYKEFRSYDDWMAHHSERKVLGLPAVESAPYKADKHWDWRDTEESFIEQLILDPHGAKKEDWFPVILIFAMLFAGAWLILEIVVDLVFGRAINGSGLTGGVPLDTGLVILFALCGTVLGSVAMWCVTVYKLRMAQLRERKEIRETEYNTKLLEKMEHSGGRLTMRELNR